MSAKGIYEHTPSLSQFRERAAISHRILIHYVRLSMCLNAPRSTVRHFDTLFAKFRAYASHPVLTHGETRRSTLLPKERKGKTKRRKKYVSARESRGSIGTPKVRNDVRRSARPARRSARVFVNNDETPAYSRKWILSTLQRSALEYR